jgi:hypothetical protein
MSWGDFWAWISVWQLYAGPQLCEVFPVLTVALEQIAWLFILDNMVEPLTQPITKKFISKIIEGRSMVLNNWVWNFKTQHFPCKFKDVNNSELNLYATQSCMTIPKLCDLFWKEFRILMFIWSWILAQQQLVFNPRSK